MHKNRFHFQTLQNFMYTMLKDNNAVAAKMSLVSKMIFTDSTEPHVHNYNFEYELI